MKLVSDFDALRVTISQVASEVTEDTKKRIESVAQQVEEATRIQTEFVSKFSEKAAEELRQHHSEMLHASRNMTAAVRRVADRVDKVEVPADTIKNRLALIEIPSDAIKIRLQSVDIPSDTIKTRLDAVEIPSDFFTAKFQGVLGSLQEVVEGFAEQAASESSVMEKLTTLVKATAEAAEGLKRRRNGNSGKMTVSVVRGCRPVSILLTRS